MRAVPVEPSGNGVRIGARLRDARARQGLTIDDVATVSGLTKGFISRLERDLVSPSVATLVSLCEVLSLPVGELFAEPDTVLIRRDEAPRIQLSGAGAEEFLLTARSQGRLQFVRSHIAPGGNGGPELYTLNAALEVLHVISGTIHVQFASHTEKLGAGDTVSFSGREPHNWENRTKRQAEVIWVISPAPWDTNG